MLQKYLRHKHRYYTLTLSVIFSVIKAGLPFLFKYNAISKNNYNIYELIAQIVITVGYLALNPFLYSVLITH